MIATRSYSPCEASILASYGAFDDIFASEVETAPRPISIAQRPAIRERQEKLFVTCNYGSSTNFEHLKEHIASTMMAEYIHTFTSWIDSFSGIEKLSTNSASLSASGTSEELTKNEAAIWYNEFHYLSSINKTREALDLLFSHTEEAFDVSDLHKLDCMLRQIKPNDLPAEMLVSVLRATSRAKASLPSWKDLFTFAKELAKQEVLPSRMLRGL